MKRKRKLAALGINMADLVKRADSLHEINPMMGHRGVRLGVTFPEITEMQVRAIYEAAAELTKEGKALPEIMIPVTWHEGARRPVRHRRPGCTRRCCQVRRQEDQDLTAP
jgi:phosphoenolpyruvate synthase/pyruvate phosphate dikinase